MDKNYIKLKLSLFDIKYAQKYIHALSFSFIENPSCKGCHNNPENGGSGICACTLGTPKITC